MHVTAQDDMPAVGATQRGLFLTTTFVRVPNLNKGVTGGSYEMAIGGIVLETCTIGRMRGGNDVLGHGRDHYIHGSKFGTILVVVVVLFCLFNIFAFLQRQLRFAFI